jgi:hypothetical protein
MRQLLACLLIGVSVSAALAGDNLMDLDQAIHAALAKPVPEDFEVEMADARLRRLEAMNGRHFDLTPQLGLLSLANPVALATSVGVRLFSRQGGATPLMLLDAQLDRIASQLAVRRRRFQDEAEVTRRFYSVSENQRLAARVCADAEQSAARRDQLKKEVALARLTRADVLRFEQEILDRQSECRRAGQRLQTANLYLAAAVGRPAVTLGVDEDGAAALSVEYPLRPVDYLVSVAFTYRGDRSPLREELARYRAQVEGVRAPRLLQFSVGYSRYGRQVGGGQSGFPAQGLESDISIRLSGNKDFLAEKRLLLARINKLERELDEFDQATRLQIAETRIRFQSQRDELMAARQRLALAAELRLVVAARKGAGLEQASALASARTQERNAGLDLLRVEYETKSALASLLQLCGLRWMGRQGQDMLAARPAHVLTASLP